MAKELTDEEMYRKQSETIEFTYGNKMFKAIDNICAQVDKVLGDDESLTLRDGLVDLISKYELPDSVTGTERIWADDTGDVLYDEDGEGLIDLDNKPIEYNEKGELINKNVSDDMLYFINYHFNRTDDVQSLVRATS